MKQITLSGIIGWDVEAYELRDQLKAANGEDVEIIISSPGGLVGQALEMYNLIRNYSGKTTARLSGYAMSAASYIPLAADRIVAEDNAIYMIHNVRGGVLGDHNDILHYGNTVKSMSAMLAKAYAKRTGKDEATIAHMMDKETYFFGEEMVEHGFVDELIDAPTDTDRETAMTTAMFAFDGVVARLKEESEAVKNDITRAAALAGNVITNRAQAPAKPATKQEINMTKEELLSGHPDLVAAITAEAREGLITPEALQQQIDTAKAEGAEGERERIAALQEVALPGYDDLINQAIADGSSTAEQVALKIIAEEKKRGATAAANMDADAPPVVPPVADGDEGKKMKRADFNNLDLQAQRDFVRGGGKVLD